MRLEEYWLAFGNGDRLAGDDIAQMIAERLNEARKKHPVFAIGPWHALGVIGAEYKEFEHAVLYENGARQIDEALNLIATAIRFINDEYEKHF